MISIVLRRLQLSRTTVLLQFCLGVEIVLNGISRSPALFPVPAASLILTPAQLLH